MSLLRLNAYKAERSGPFLSLDLGLGRDPPFPSRIVEVKTAKDCEAAFEAYTADAEASGLPLAVSMIMVRGERKPSGFNKLKTGPRPVNLPEA